MARTEYLWDEVFDTLIGEYDENGDQIAWYTTDPDLYGSVISQHRADSGTSFYHHDAQGNTIALTNQNGNTTDTYAYTAFGDTAANIGTATNPFRFGGALGYYANPETGDHYIRERMYRSIIARWLSRDPFDEDAGVDLLDPSPILAPYQYALNNPIRYSDPSGLQAKENVCCDCEDAVRRLQGEFDYQYDYYLIQAYHPQPLHPKGPPDPLYRCRVNIACEPVKACGPKGKPGTLPGFTNPPMEVLNNPLYQYEIDICVSCRYSPIDYLIQHELVHARQYCADPTLDLFDCTKCKTAETQAHTVNCWLAFGDNKVKRDRCIACGVAISCAGPCPPKKVDPKTGLPIINGKACDLSKDFGGIWAPVK